MSNTTHTHKNSVSVNTFSFICSRFITQKLCVFVLSLPLSVRGITKITSFTKSKSKESQTTTTTTTTATPTVKKEGERGGGREAVVHRASLFPLSPPLRETKKQNRRESSREPSSSWQCRTSATLYKLKHTHKRQKRRAWKPQIPLHPHTHAHVCYAIVCFA